MILERAGRWQHIQVAIQQLQVAVKFHQFPTSKLLSAGKERQYCRLMMVLHIMRHGHRQDKGGCSLILEACATCPSTSTFVSAPAKSKNPCNNIRNPRIRPTACITIMSTAAAAAAAEAETVLPAPDHQPINQSNGAHLWSSPIFQLHIRRCGYRTSHRFIPISSHFSSCSHGVVQSKVCTCARSNCHMSNFCEAGTCSSTSCGC